MKLNMTMFHFIPIGGSPIVQSRMEIRMSRIAPVSTDLLIGLDELFARVYQSAGYLPVGIAIMARKPKIARAVMQLFEAVMPNPGQSSPADWILT